MFKNIFLKCEPTFWLTHNMKQIESSKQVTLHITNNLNKSQSHETDTLTIIYYT